jgi:NAD(P)-dependent dehydrogenase (short-subunit alcohol dehydrogenase family)
MNVTVFGATGQIGRLVVDDLLHAGHDVTAYVRNPDKLTTVDPRLVNVTGELSDGQRIRQAIHGADAVISAMDAEKIGRFIGLATPSVPDERDEPTLKAKALPIIAGFLFPNALADIIGMTTAVTQSRLDWTIARITNPNNGTPKGTVRAGFLGRDKIGSAMSRADIAAFLVAQLTDDGFSRATPAISN